MEEAITKLHAYIDWIRENEDSVYWIKDENIQEMIDLLESELTAEEFGRKEL